MGRTRAIPAPGSAERPLRPPTPTAGPGEEAGTPGADGAGNEGEGANEAGKSAVSPPEGRQKPPVLRSNAKVNIDWVDVEIGDLVRYMAEITGRNFILGEKLTGKVTIISNKQVSVAEAYEAFLSALEVAGYTTVTVGNTTKVVKSAEAAKTPLRIYEGGDIPYTDNFITQIIQMDNVSVSDISSVVKELASSSGRVVAYQPTNTLIITDSASNIRRIYKIISELDVAAPKSKLEIIALKYATAADVQKIIEDLYGVEGSTSSSTAAPESAAAASRRRRGRTGATEPEAAPTAASTTTVGEGTYISKIIADERTNSLIIKANEEAMSAILELVGRLDVDVDPASRAQIHVVYLEHAKAADLSQVIQSLAGGSGGSYGGTSSTARRPGTSTGTSTQQKSSTMGGGRQYGGGGMGGGGLPLDDDLPMGGAGGPGGVGGSSYNSGNSIFESGLRVTADDSTNSLVVVAGPEEFQVLKQVIDKLDIRRKQVFVEGVILEMGTDESFDAGIGYHFGVPTADGGLTAYSAQLNGSSLGLSAADLLSGLAVGVFGQSIDVPMTDLSTGTATTVSVPAFGVALNALQSNSAVDILSTPNVLTMDNEEAKIIVGRNIPYPISTGYDSNNNPIVSYQREDVAITLKVTPQINESNFVTLDVFQEVQEIEEDNQGLDPSTAGFITSKRSAETTVVVQDNQTVVIGGLISTTDTKVETKIPVLGDLPLLGALFRGKRTESRKTNLLIFLTPHVIDTPEDLEEIYRVKVAQRDAFMNRFYGKSRDKQEQAMQDLLRYSMNLVDEPSAFRTKVAAAPEITTIQTRTAPTETTPPKAIPLDGGTQAPGTHASPQPTTPSQSATPSEPATPSQPSTPSEPATPPTGEEPSTPPSGDTTPSPEGP
jgi:general secretion pathway protein D